MRHQTDILRDVKTLALEYYETTSKPLGVTGEIAEVEAADALGLELAEARCAGYDAVRPGKARRRKIQIKGRWKKEGKKWGRVPSINTTLEFDSVMLVLMCGDYELFEIWEADRKSVIDRLEAPGSKARNERKSMSVSQFKSVAQRIWPESLA